MDLHEKDKPLRSFLLYFFVFLGAMGVVWWISSLGPDRVDTDSLVTEEIVSGRDEDVDNKQLLQESKAAEEAFNEVRERSDDLQPEAVILLEESIRFQRAYIDGLGHVDVKAIARLKELESRLQNEQAAVLLDKSIALEEEGRSALSEGDLEQGANALYQAAYLQQEINKTYPLSDAADYGRPVRLSRLIQDLEAKPLSENSYSLEKEARQALASGKVQEAKEFFSEALDVQEIINNEYKNTQYVNLRRVRTLRAELQNLQAVAVYETFSKHLAEAKSLDTEGHYTDAVTAYEKALALQEQINGDFPYSQYASATLASAIRSSIQVARGQIVLEEFMKYWSQLKQSLHRNQPQQAEGSFVQVKQIWEELKRNNPLIVQENKALSERVEYLLEHKSSMEVIFRLIYPSLLPVEGVSGGRMLNTEVQQALYMAVMDKNPSRHVGDSLPVDSVRYEDVQLFCKRLGIWLGRTVSLPQEDTFRRAVGVVNAGALLSETWNDDNSNYKTHPVGSKSPNAQGFFDLLGNVAEWLHSDTGVEALVAGGSIDDGVEQLASVPMQLISKTDRSRSVGFRVFIGD